VGRVASELWCFFDSSLAETANVSAAAAITEIKRHGKRLEAKPVGVQHGV